MGTYRQGLLVLCDSRQEDTYRDVGPACISALEHWGMPYRCHDLAEGQPSAEMLNAYAAVVLAQQNLCTALSHDTARVLSEAVADGLGYVGCDGNVGHMPPALQQIIAVRAEGVRPTIDARVVDAGHYVSQWQVQGERYRFCRPLEVARVTPTMARVRVLLESDHHPAMWVTRYGRGRAVQWALSPRVWQREVFGHCEGLDDLLWRGIVWVAKKPFPALAMPPFSTARVGDAMGAHDFAWIEIMSRYGFSPNVGVFPDDIDALSEVRGQSNFFDRAVDTMHRCTDSNRAEFSPHAATWNRAYLLYDRADGSEIPSAELVQRFAAVDKQFARYGISWAHTVNPHYCQLGYNALPFLMARGVEFTISSILPGETWDGEHTLWESAPYDHPGFTIAPLPNAPDFYVVTSGCSHYQVTDATGPRTYRYREDTYLMEADFMWGRTRWQNQCRIDDWDAMVKAAVRQIRLGLDALFFACPATHEQTIAFVKLEEWNAFWHEVSRRVARYERWPALYSDVAAYARAKQRTRLARADFDGSVLTCELEGNPDVPLYLCVWDDFGESERVVQRYEEVVPFERSTRMVFSQL